MARSGSGRAPRAAPLSFFTFQSSVDRRVVADLQQATLDREPHVVEGELIHVGRGPWETDAVATPLTVSSARTEPDSRPHSGRTAVDPHVVGRSSPERSRFSAARTLLRPVRHVPCRSVCDVRSSARTT